MKTLKRDNYLQGMSVKGDLQTIKLACEIKSMTEEFVRKSNIRMSVPYLIASNRNKNSLENKIDSKTACQNVYSHKIVPRL